MPDNLKHKMMSLVTVTVVMVVLQGPAEKLDNSDMTDIR
jgi:hypothetical protein